jgi:hypothetical protein
MLHRRLRKSVLPAAVSAALLAGVIWRVSPASLLQKTALLDWNLLAPATIVMVVGLYLWDSICLPVVYQSGSGRITYGQALHLRGLSYLGGALNYELGQGVLAWAMARLQNTSLVRMLARSVLLAYHDIFVLLLAGGLGTLISGDPRAARFRPYIAVGLLVAVGIGVIVWLLPEWFRAKFRWGDRQSLLEGWSVARSGRLLVLRAIYFSILVVYGLVAIRICRLPVDTNVVLTAVPIVLLADGLPSFAGLGTREAALLFLLRPPTKDDEAQLVTMSLFWSTGMIVVRFIIASAHLWIHAAHDGIGIRFGKDPDDEAILDAGAAAKERGTMLDTR